MSLSACSKEVPPKEGSTHTNGTDELREEKLKVEKYLSEKYGKEFAVEDSYYFRSQLGTKPVIKTNAYPNDNTKIRIEVTKLKDGKYRDNYLQLFWSNEANNEISETIENLYRSRTIYHVGVGINDLEFYDQKWGETPTYKDSIKTYNDRLSYSIYLAIFNDLKQDSFEAEYESIYKIIEFVKSVGFKRNSIYIGYYKADQMENVKMESSKNSISNIIIGDIEGAFENTGRILEYYVKIGPDEFNSITQYKDIVGQIEKQNRN